MISARKAKANRANAKTSSGPKTANGKARSAQNSLRHGLSLSLIADPANAEDLKTLQRQIAGKRASAEVRELAGRIAAAQLELLRVRAARQDLLASKAVDAVYQNFGPPKKIKKKSRLVARAAQQIGPTARIPREIIAVLTKQLMAMDRYERRALSRRKFAIHELDLAQRGR